MEVRPVTDDDLTLLEERFRQGLVVYLVAWHGDQPVGHALLKWGGPGTSTLPHVCTECVRMLRISSCCPRSAR